MSRTERIEALLEHYEDRIADYACGDAGLELLMWCKAWLKLQPDEYIAKKYEKLVATCEEDWEPIFFEPEEKEYDVL
jgi:hypothetical protein